MGGRVGTDVRSLGAGSRRIGPLRGVGRVGETDVGRLMGDTSRDGGRTSRGGSRGVGTR